MSFNPVRALRDAAITTKLVSIVLAFVFAILGMMLLITFALRVTSGTRAYVYAEGLWSKGQRDAVYYLSRYVTTHDAADYDRYAHAVAVPLGYRKGRIELSKAEFDPAVVLEGFAAGGQTAEDAASMIFLYRNFQNIGYFARAISLWREADQEIERLIATSAEASRAIQAGHLDPAMQASLLAQIDRINADVTPLETGFSQSLGEGSSAIQLMLFLTMIVSALSLLLMGLAVTSLISRQMNASITALRDGALRVASGNLNHPILVESRDELGALGQVFNDMIERRREEESALRTANEFRERVMDSSTNAIYTMDREGRFTTANRRTCEITGYPPEELIGTSWASMVPPEHLAELLPRYLDTVEGREPILNHEVPLIQKSGQVVTITFSVTPLRRDGVIFGVVGTAEDITERKRAEAEARAHSEELARSNQELEQFAYVASHDLQEPLRTVSGFAQLLARRYQGKLDSDADEYIHYVTSGVQRMKSLIEDLLAFSRVTRNAAALQNIDLNQVVKTALANLQGAIEAAGASVDCAPLPTVKANERQLVQLFQNLIGNAIKFRTEAAPKVTIAVRLEDSHWRFTVRDNGIGIRAEFAEQVFLLFQRLHGRDKYAGNGIGLTICKKIIDLHGGRIWVEPNEGGAVFCFTLPAELGRRLAA